MAEVRPVSATARKVRQDNIDLLRAVAILAVMLYHFTSRFPPGFYKSQSVPFTFPYGHFGVDLFFVVSGYCIFMTLDSSRSLENFWARRLARIQPAYVAAIVLTMFVVELAGLPGRTSGPLVALSNMVWLNAIPKWPMVDSAYWSLVVELKFYFWVGLVYYLCRGRNVSLAWLSFSLVGAALALHGGLLKDYITALAIAPFAPAFLAGMLAWEWDRLSRFSAIGLALACGVLLFVSPRFAEQPVLGPLIAIAGFAVLRMKRLRLPRAITAIGLISYSLYLVHQNIGYVLLRAIPLDYGVRLAIVFAALFAVAGLFYWSVERRWERPVQRFAESMLGRGRRTLRLPHRRLAHPTLSEEMRAW